MNGHAVDVAIVRLELGDVGFDDTLVDYAALGTGAADEESLGAVHLEQHVIARRQSDPAVRGHEAAFIGYLRGDEDDVAGAGTDPAEVDDWGFAVAVEIQLAGGHELVVVEVQGGGDKSSDVDPGVLAYDDAVRVKQKEVAVGGESSVD